MHEYEAAIIRIENIGNSIHHLVLHADDIAREVKPGQFVQVRVQQGTDPFLRRTFSVCGADQKSGTIDLLVDVVGYGTDLLCTLPQRNRLNIIGPLGTPFDPQVGGDGPCILVAGGIGTAPLLFFAHFLSQHNIRDYEFFVGGRSASALTFVDRMSGNVQFKIATDDGSLGFHGTVASLLKSSLDEKHAHAIYCCGPHPMMKAVAEIAHDASADCQISTEERMACGIGACLGCAVKMKNGDMVRSCVEGPVFDASEVAW